MSCPMDAPRGYFAVLAYAAAVQPPVRGQGAHMYYVHGIWMGSVL